VIGKPQLHCVARARGYDRSIMTAKALADFCPGILHAVPAKDGLLMRLRLPGGRLPPATLRAVADLARRHADGGLDLTARANIQLRGIRPDGLGTLVEGLTAAGLLPSPMHDRIRNILVSPFAGADPTEIVDLTPLAAALDRALIADAALADLPAKFAFTLDGGGRGFDPGGADLTLTAVGTRLHLSLASRPTGQGTTLEAAARAGRRFFGCDVGELAVATSTQRLEALERAPTAPGRRPAGRRALPSDVR